MSVRVFYDILNQKGTPAMYTDTFANRPAYGYQGRLFISTDSGQIFEDTGSAWTLVADAGVGGGTLSSVCLNGNTTATGIVITAGGLSTNSLTNTSLTTGSILFADGGGLITQSNSTFFWDNTNKRLGIGTNSPGAPLDIHGTGANAFFNGTGSNNATLVFQNAGSSKWSIGNIYGAGSNTFRIYNNITSAAALTIDNTTNAITIDGLGSYGGTISLKQNGNITAGTGYTTLGSIGAGRLNIYFGDTNLYAAEILNTSLTASRSYTLPNASGTFALLENTNTFTLTNTFSSASKYAAGVLFQQNGSYTTLNGYTGIAGVTNGLYIAMGTTAVQGLYFPTGANYGYTFPSASGTLALTSNLSSYLPLTGGTLTGALGVNLGGVSLSTTIQALSGNTGNFAAVAVGRVSAEGYLGICSTTNDFAVGTIAGDVVVSSGSSQLKLAANSNVGITINSTGKVGIANTSPTYNLDVTGTGRISSTLLSGQGTFQSTGANIISKNTTTSQANLIRFDNSVGTVRAYLGYETTGTDFYVENAEGKLLLASNSGTAMTINGLNVGIGNSNANALLTIGTTQTSPVSTADLTLGLNRYILWGTNGSGAGTVRSWGIANNELVAGDFVIKSSSTNNNTLDTVRFQITNAGVVTILALGTGTVTATSGTLSTVSDMNLKIADGFIDNALEKVLKLTPRYFYWKEESNLPTNLRQLGFYAQEVNEAIGEEAANTPKDNVSWGITDRSVIAMLTKAIQELNEKLVRNNIN
jgi:hypothetical protein